MKRSTVILLAVLVGTLWIGARLSGSGEQSAPVAPAPAAAATPKDEEPSAGDDVREEVVRYFLSSEEPSVKDAAWTQDFIFKVGMIDDGSDRSGFAEYVCEILYDYGFKGTEVWVQVIDIVKLTRTDKWEKLGEAHCI